MSIFHKDKQPLVMGILNVTNDSFSDGGDFIDPEYALEHALSMIEDGADMLDIGGESTRPFAQKVSLDQELQRTIPVIKALRNNGVGIPISIDTSKFDVMFQAVEAGANIINDIRSLGEVHSLKDVAALGVPVCLMHMQGTPETMQRKPYYRDVVAEVKTFLMLRCQQALDAGISDLCIDVGFGFGKTLEHNRTLFQNLHHFSELGYPVLVGVSRKRMFQEITGREIPKERMSGGIAASVLAAQKGCSVLRVHDVAATVDALKVLRFFDEGHPA